MHMLDSAPIWRAKPDCAPGGKATITNQTNVEITNVIKTTMERDAWGYEML